MTPLTVKDLCDCAFGRVIFGAQTELGEISTDSRKIVPQGTFFCLRGERLDGHQFALQAAQQGATCIVADQKGADSIAPQLQALSTPVTLISVPDTTIALGYLSGVARKRFQGTVVGVTGSSGKTTTKEMLAAVLSAGGEVCATKGNLNNHIGVPLTLLNLKDQRFAVIEMGMSAPLEITWLASLAQPQLGVITTVGSAHLQGLGSLEAIAAAKGELFQALPESGCAFMPSQIDYPWQLTRNLKAPLILVGERPTDAWQLSHYRNTPEGSSAIVETRGQRWPLRLKLFGKHNAQNALLALAVADHCAVPITQALDALAQMEAPKLRGETCYLRDHTPVVLDCYNANPQSMSASIQTFAARYPDGILVLGDMLELGEGSEAAHEEIGRLVARLPGELTCIGVGPESERMIRAARNEGTPSGRSFWAPDRSAALEILNRRKPGQAILFKASRGMALEKIWESLQGEEE